MKIGVKRYFYSDRGKHYMLAGVPWSWVNSAPAGTLIIDPTTTATSTDDTRLEDGTPHGGETTLAIGKTGGVKRRTIIKFNITGIPSNATVLTATMYLWYTGNNGTPIDRWVQVHQLLVPWNEMEATKTLRMNGVNWAADYGAINGTDAKATYESSLFFDDAGPVNINKPWDLTALTQKWVWYPNPNGVANYGVILWATNEEIDGQALQFNSSEVGLNYPYMTIIYSQLPRTVYFLKDHLGSIRASVQDTATAPVVGYDDYDPWGYILSQRSMIAGGWGSQAGIVKNKFTGKEWDDDYSLNWVWVDRRPYMPDIGRWAVMEPLADKSPHLSPYVYAFNNPILFFDPNGKYPFTIHVRTFAPFNWFGGGFKGDSENRRFTTDVGASFKIRQEVSIESTTMEITNRLARGSVSVGGWGVVPFWNAYSEAYGEAFLQNNSLVTHLYGNNDAATELSADIDVHTLLYISTAKGDDGNEILTFQGGALGDLFPAAEAFVKDASGTAVFLGVSAAGGSAGLGPYKMLPGDRKRGMFSVKVSIIVNSKGQFIGVLVDGKRMSIEEWNKQFEEEETK